MHSVRSACEFRENKAALVKDVKKIFICLNPLLALEKKTISPALSCFAQDSYTTPSVLFVAGTRLQSQESKNPGGPMAMVMYGIAIVQLIDLMRNLCITQN